jgi:hypothetical protein
MQTYKPTRIILTISTIVIIGVAVTVLLLVRPWQSEQSTSDTALDPETQVDFQSAPGNPSVEMKEDENGKMVPYFTANKATSE